MVNAVLVGDTRDPASGTQRDIDYQCSHCGGMEFRVWGEGNYVWADGIDVPNCRLQDCKLVRDAADSPRVTGQPAFLWINQLEHA
jgi:hypothetical protein